MTTDMFDLLEKLSAFLRTSVNERAQQAQSDIDHFDDPGSPKPDPCNVWIVKTAREVLADLAAISSVLDVCDNLADPWEVVPVLKHLALPYADRPGYREEWRP